MTNALIISLSDAHAKGFISGGANPTGMAFECWGCGVPVVFRLKHFLAALHMCDRCAGLWESDRLADNGKHKTAHRILGTTCFDAAGSGEAFDIKTDPCVAVIDFLNYGWSPPMVCMVTGMYVSECNCGSRHQCPECACVVPDDATDTDTNVCTCEPGVTDGLLAIVGWE